MDEHLFRTIYGGASPSGVIYALMVALTVLGSGWSMLALVPFAAMRRTRRASAFLLATLIATSLVVFLLKIAIHRVRPCATLSDVHALCFTAPTDPSFPSGHAAGGFAFAVFVGTLVLRSSLPSSQKLVACTLLGSIALGIALSRVYLGVHFPTDVAAGGAVGSLLGLLGAKVEQGTSTPDNRSPPG